jgi:hypothetical protein
MGAHGMNDNEGFTLYDMRDIVTGRIKATVLAPDPIAASVILRRNHTDEERRNTHIMEHALEYGVMFSTTDYKGEQLPYAWAKSIKKPYGALLFQSPDQSEARLLRP